MECEDAQTNLRLVCFDPPPPLRTKRKKIHHQQGFYVLKNPDINVSLFFMPQNVFPRVHAKNNDLAQRSFKSTRKHTQFLQFFSASSCCASPAPPISVLGRCKSCSGSLLNSRVLRLLDLRVASGGYIPCCFLRCFLLC